MSPPPPDPIESELVRLLDGPDEDFWPYFAMEYVKGVPLTRYCDENRLSLEDRLRLFKQVCSTRTPRA